MNTGLSLSGGLLLEPIALTLHLVFEPAVETPLDTSSSGCAVDLIVSDDIASFSFDVRLGSIIMAIRDKASQPLRLLLGIHVHRILWA